MSALQVPLPQSGSERHASHQPARPDHHLLSRRPGVQGMNMTHDPILRFHWQLSADASAWRVRSFRCVHAAHCPRAMQASALTSPDCLRESALLTARICFPWRHRCPRSPGRVTHSEDSTSAISPALLRHRFGAKPAPGGTAPLCFVRCGERPTGHGSSQNSFQQHTSRFAVAPLFGENCSGHPPRKRGLALGSRAPRLAPPGVP